MSTKIKFSTLAVLSTQFFISQVALASNGVSIQSDGIILNYCDSSHVASSFKVTSQGTKITSGKTDELGCLYTTLKGLNSCDDVTLVFKSDKVVYQVPGDYCSSTQSPAKTPSKEAPKDVADLDKVKKTADNRARQFANQVASNFEYGKSNYLYNFIIGYEHGINMDENQTYYQFAFEKGQTKGSQLGRSAGYQVGVDAATNMAQDKAKKDVYAQIYQGLDSGKDVVAAPDKSTPSYSGASDSLEKVTIDQVLSSSETHDLLLAKIYDDGYSLSESQVSSVMNRSMNLREILSDLDSDWAFKSHLNEKANSDYVNSLNSKDNANEAIATYEAQFKEVYWSVIDDKVAKKIVQPQMQAQQSGKSFGLSRLAVVAKSQGESSGYSSAYKPASINGFTSTYPAVYSNSFGSEVTRLNNSMEIADVKAAITDAQGGTQFVIGQPVKLVVNQIVNVGKLSGQVDVTISGAIQAHGVLDVKGQSRNQGLVVENIGHISSAATLGTQKIQITINGVSVSQNIEITWANQLKALATVQDPEVVGNLSKFVVSTLLQEWKTMLNNKTVVQEQILYRDAKAYPKSLMGQFESLAATLKAKNPDTVKSIAGPLLTVLYSMLSPASVESYATTWLPKTVDPEAYKKAYSDAREQVVNSPALSQLASGCVIVNGSSGSCVGVIEMRSSDDYNKWFTGKAKVEAILRK
ncbi:MAG: hypothetical protein ACXVCY_06665 [Pseudobdellovibrionaceae bacterium]